MKSQTKAIRAFDDALAQFTAARKILDLVAQDEPKDGPNKDLIASYYEAVDKDIKETMIHKASNYYSRGSLKNALNIVNEVLAKDTKYQPALAMRARIESSMNDNDDFRRGRPSRGSARTNQ